MSTVYHRYRPVNLLNKIKGLAAASWSNSLTCIPEYQKIVVCFQLLIFRINCMINSFLTNMYELIMSYDVAKFYVLIYIRKLVIDDKS